MDLSQNHIHNQSAANLYYQFGSDNPFPGMGTQQQFPPFTSPFGASPSTNIPHMDWNPATMLDNLTFIEEKIRQVKDVIRTMVDSGGQLSCHQGELSLQKQQVVNADLTCLIVQLISTAGSLLPSLKNSSFLSHPAAGHMDMANHVGPSSGLVPNAMTVSEENKEDMCSPEDYEELFKGWTDGAIEEGIEIDNVLVEEQDMKDGDEGKDGENLPPDTVEAATIRIVEMLTIFPLVFRTFKRCCRFLRVEKDLVAMTEKAAQNDALKAKVEALQGQLDVKKSLALLKERMAYADAKHNNTKTQCESLKSQSQVEEIPGLRSQVKALGEVGTALRCEKAGLEAELKPARPELEKCQIEVKSLRKRIQTLDDDEEEVAWLGSGEHHKAAITAFEVEQDKMIRDKSAQDSEIETFHAELKKFKSQVESYKSQLKAAKLEKKAALEKLKTSKEKAKCHLIDTLTSCSGYLLALVQSANPDFDPSSIDWAFRRPDPDAEALI
ncbi:unnamed protein product [Miscanthus lutarioriparius]|uniref:Uncharacterized protein n=1 Tax=Miscanthus lutarioriparius TaxID=422564 RepID=A0A811RKV2_9POAL|nr:unnamed protein product [Miscanthus lutarioriparius]